MSQLQTSYVQQIGLVESQTKFINNVLQICKVQTCAQAVEYLGDIHRKADFYHRTSDLVQAVTLSEPAQSVKESWRRTKDLISDYVDLNEQNKQFLIELSLEPECSHQAVITCLKLMKADSARIKKIDEMKLFGNEDIETVLKNVKVSKLERHLER